MSEVSSQAGQAAESARELAEQLFGKGVCETEGVVHVTATVRVHDGRLRVLATGQGAPQSAFDFFALNLCRARADALLTTAENLRAEPHLRHELAGEHAGELDALRAELLQKQGPPRCAILTRTGDLPLEHPVWSDGTAKLVLTVPDTAERLAARLGDRAQVIGVPELDARKALDVLREEGARTISIEAGPRTATQLYSPSSVIDELLLSRCETGELAPNALVGALPEDARLFAGLGIVHESVRDEPSGRWVFQRWARVRS
jgi:riboflavin biosynthesis pyrimidine reductase